MKTMNCGRRTLLGVAGVAGLCAASIAGADINIDFDDGVEYVGGEFTRLNDLMLDGALDVAAGDFILQEDGENFTWADDLTVLVGNFEGDELHMQIGGYTDLGATYRYSWPEGANGDAGTFGGGVIDIGGVDVSGYYLWLGNGYTSGGLGIWTGQIGLDGSITYVPAPAAAALLGLGGLAARRRRR